MTYKEHTQCRACESKRLVMYLDLGMLPLSNNLAKSTLDRIHDERYPLQVLLCRDCGLSQLSIVIPPEVMFSHYVYRSSISHGYKVHCHNMAVNLQTSYGLNINSFHIDIAGNDGALLEQFKKFLGHKILNVDPAENIAPIAEAAGIPTLTKFWGLVTAKSIVNTYGQADLITATNVIAHVDDIKEFIEAAGLALKPTGVLVLEFPYLIDMIEGKAFDTIYFEHLSYLLINPLVIICKGLGLNVMNVTRQDIHGGSVRVIIGNGVQDETVKTFLKDEEKFMEDEIYRQFEKDVKSTISNFREFIFTAKATGKVIAGFAASAKGNTLLNCSGITVGSMRCIIDQTPEKIGKYSPGTRIPIVSMMDLLRVNPDILVILAWNFADEIIAKCRKAGYQGRFVIPIPEVNFLN